MLLLMMLLLLLLARQGIPRSRLVDCIAQVCFRSVVARESRHEGGVVMGMAVPTGGEVRCLIGGPHSV